MRRRLLAETVLALALAACAAPPPPPQPPASADPRVVIVPGLPVTAGAPVFQEVGARRVTVMLGNATPQDLPVLATVDWLDSRGRPIPSVVSRPRGVVVPRFGEAAIDSIAASPSATDFRIRVELDPANL